MQDTGPADRLRARLRRDLTVAMKARRAEEVAAIRSVVAAIDEAEAVAVQAGTRPRGSTSEHFAGAVAGVGSGDAPKRELNEADLEELLDVEITDRREQAEEFEALARPDEALRLRDQAAVITRYREGLPH